MLSTFDNLTLAVARRCLTYLFNLTFSGASRIQPILKPLLRIKISAGTKSRAGDVINHNNESNQRAIE